MLTLAQQSPSARSLIAPSRAPSASGSGAARRALARFAVAGVLVAGAFGITSSAADAMSMPDWAADFAAAGDAFDTVAGGSIGGPSVLPGSGYYYAYVNGQWVRVDWKDYSNPGGGAPIRKCTTSGASIPCP